MSTRNKATALSKTLGSIRRQAIPFEYEIVVADDGSTDNTRDVCRQYGVRYLYLDNNRYRNPSAARNDAYRAAMGDIIIAQSDDVLHKTPDAVEQLVGGLQSGSVLIATVLNMNDDGTPRNNPFPIYSGPKQPRAFFFLGAMWRSDLYAFGGNHEGFVEPCWDDNWLQDCLLQGLNRKLDYAPDVIGHHQGHDFPIHSHDNECRSKELYYRLRREATIKRRWLSPGAPWPTTWPTIPKRMSFFWGGEKLSWMRYMTLASFRKLHPDWQMCLYRVAGGASVMWTSSEQEDVSSYMGQDYASKLDSIGVEQIQWTCPVSDLSVTHASDICEWEILSNQGGFYADMDVLFVKPLDYDNLCKADALFCLSDGYMTIGFVGSSPGNLVFNAILHEAKHRVDASRYQSTGAEALYRLAGIGSTWPTVAGPGRLAIDYFRNQFPQMRFRTLHSASIYPWSYLQVDQIFNAVSKPPEDCVAIHWFGANQISQRWNNLLSEDNWTKYDNTFTRYVKRLL